MTNESGPAVRVTVAYDLSLCIDKEPLIAYATTLLMRVKKEVERREEYGVRSYGEDKMIAPLDRPPFPALTPCMLRRADSCQPRP